MGPQMELDKALARDPEFESRLERLLLAHKGPESSSWDGAVAESMAYLGVILGNIRGRLERTEARETQQREFRQRLDSATAEYLGVTDNACIMGPPTPAGASKHFRQKRS